jgi:hypothetical protein
MLKRVACWLPLVALAAPLFAGGFWLQFGDAGSSSDAKARNAVFVVKPAGCHNPELAKVTASAEGIVNGTRKSVPLTLIPLSEAGSYAVARAWPDSGKWVVSISATADGRQTGAIAKLGSSGFNKEDAKFMAHVPTQAEIESTLRSF